MEFNIDRIENKKRGRKPTISDDEIIAAVNSGLFSSNSSIARYFNVTPSAIQKRITKLKERGIL